MSENAQAAADLMSPGSGSKRSQGRRRRQPEPLHSQPSNYTGPGGSQLSLPPVSGSQDGPISQQPMSQQFTDGVGNMRAKTPSSAMPGSNAMPGTGQKRHHRRDVGAGERRRMGGARSQHDQAAPGPEAADGDDENYVWGTQLNVADIEERFERFILQYVEPQAGEDPSQAGARRPKYRHLLQQTLDNSEPRINIDMTELHQFDPRLYSQTKDYPREVIPIMDAVLRGIAEKEFNMLPEDSFQASLYNMLPLDTKAIRDLDPGDLDKLVAIRGMVTRTSSVIPELRVAMFSCEACSAERFVHNENGKLDEPEKCAHCGSKFTLRMVHNRSEFLNKQHVKMQEQPDNIPEGETPHAVLMYAYELCVDQARPGDRVTITGIYRGMPLRVNPRQRACYALYKTYLDIIHIQRDETAQMFAASAPCEPSSPLAAASQEDTQAQGMPDSEEPAVHVLGNMSREELAAKEQQLKDLAARPDIVELLTRSVAPRVWHMEDVKKGLLCQMFGGCAKSFTGGKIRGDLNVLVMGDPSVSKSQLLSYVHMVAPRGIYTSGKGSSAVGLTAYVTRDPETNELVLESGALVLSDRGICCIDEFDKMSDAARSMLHEVMEQQTVSVAKAGLISVLNARTSVLAAANPKGSKYDPGMSLTENINLPPSLLSRFDLVYLVQDEQDERRDAQLAEHLVAMFYSDDDRKARRNQQEVLPTQTMKEYIAYARTRVQPRISEAAASYLAQQYQTMRSMGRDRHSVVVTPRQLESVIRLSEALARMRLSRVVTAEHAKEAVKLWHAAFNSSARNRQGELDLDIMATGVSNSDRLAMGKYKTALLVMLDTAFETGARYFSLQDYHKALLGLVRSGGGRQGLELPPEALVTMSALQAALPGLSDKYVLENDMIRLVQAPR